MAAPDPGQAMLRHDNDWAGRAIAAETLVLNLESELLAAHADYQSVHRNVREAFIDREEELEESVRINRDAYFALVSFIIMHEPVLREYYEERSELPKGEFEQLMHELHTSLIFRAAPEDDQDRDDDTE